MYICRANDAICRANDACIYVELMMQFRSVNCEHASYRIHTH